MKQDKYQGWSNWDTWNANLWLTNEEWAYRLAKKAPTIEDLISIWKNFLEGKDGIQTEKVNFEEIYKSLHEYE